jgi:hypothetical protein
LLSQLPLDLVSNAAARPRKLSGRRGFMLAKEAPRLG